ncbi:hypothetical protein Q8F55_004913 [Vanrija albida]|uniref:Uncharacterized protein n=1 Tax=Vanrija albida TaxID=181172 RepID=A0ABR3Q0E3_9TREE
MPFRRRSSQSHRSRLSVDLSSLRHHHKALSVDRGSPTNSTMTGGTGPPSGVAPSPPSRGRSPEPKSKAHHSLSHLATLFSGSKEHLGHRGSPATDSDVRHILPETFSTTPESEHAKLGPAGDADHGDPKRWSRTSTHSELSSRGSSSRVHFDAASTSLSDKADTTAASATGKSKKPAVELAFPPYLVPLLVVIALLLPTGNPLLHRLLSWESSDASPTLGLSPDLPTTFEDDFYAIQRSIRTVVECLACVFALWQVQRTIGPAASDRPHALVILWGQGLLDTLVWFFIGVGGLKVLGVGVTLLHLVAAFTGVMSHWALGSVSTIWYALAFASGWLSWMHHPLGVAYKDSQHKLYLHFAAAGLVSVWVVKHVLVPWAAAQ